MPRPPVMPRISSRFESFIVVVLQFIMMLMIGIAVFELLKLIYLAMAAHLFDVSARPIAQITDVGSLQRILQRAFGGVLLVLLGLELLDTLKSYSSEHRLRLEIILIVAIIAVGRHVILLDFEHLEGWTLIGIALLVIALTGGYFLIKTLSSSGHARE